MQHLSFEVKNNTGVITLHRPDALNALTLGMITHLHQKLKIWEKQADVHQILILSQDDKAFCAGGDLRAIYAAYQQNDFVSIQAYFKAEYDLNTYIKYYPKPYMAILNGIAMGGGLGISLHGSTKIALNTLSLAMPETGIGFFPDVGATYFLSRCPGQIGIYLGLTGTRLNATEALYAGLIDHIIGKAPAVNHLEIYRNIIDRCFQYNSIEEILSDLLKENTVFARDIYHRMLTKSPRSLTLTLKALRQAANLDFKACMSIEYQLAGDCIENQDFFEGIRAVIIDKDHKPLWQPC